MRVLFEVLLCAKTQLNEANYIQTDLQLCRPFYLEGLAAKRALCVMAPL